MNLKVLVHYVVFHADNHQGGSGKLFKYKVLIEVPDNHIAGFVNQYISEAVFKRAKQDTTWSDADGFNVSIQKAELLL